MEKFRDSSLPLEERIDALLEALTVEEKLGFVGYRNAAVPRLGIPPYVWWNEALHGLARSGAATVFPQAIAMAATFSTELVERMGEVIAEEGNARYADSVRHGDFGTYKGLTYWSPNVNIFRDPRWGRGQETYGECPFLTGELGSAYVRGVQGSDPEHLKAVATPKHFAVHSGPEKDRLGFDAAVSEKDLRETYLPAFEKCVKAGAQSVMSAYNAVNGVPCSVNQRLLTDILRGEWGFDGAVVSDAGAGCALVDEHGKFGSYAEGVAAELKSGVDVATDADPRAGEALRAGLITGEDLDRALRNQFRVKFRLGMFDADRAYPSCDVIECDAHRALALEAARKSLVLLKNEAETLPLDPARLRSVAVIGPNADSRDVLLGNYCGTPSRPVTVLAGIQEALAGKCRVIYARGCELVSLRTENCAEDGDRLAEAVSAAERADVSIVCVGLDPRIEGEAGDAYNSDASGDKLSLELPGLQKVLIEKVAAVGRPVVLVVLSGSALAIPEAYAGAVVQAFYPGAGGGTAVADVLFGKVSPSGKLPVTFYRSAEELPPFADYSMAGRTYRFFRGEVLHPFGFGLSYTRFRYSGLAVPDRSEAGVPVAVSVEVENIGERGGDEVVQLYVSKLGAGYDDPLRQLAGMARVSLAPGERRRIEFRIDPEAFLLTAADGRRRIAPGRWRIAAGGSSVDTIDAETVLELRQQRD